MGRGGGMTRSAMVKIEKEYKHVTDDKDRYGNSRYYYRRAGMKKTRLPDIHAPEFEAAYDAAKAAADRWCDEAGLKHCSAHGLRKAAATIAAENGATAHQLMSIFGWTTLQQAEVYTKAAEQKRLAGSAMHLILPTVTQNAAATEIVPLGQDFIVPLKKEAGKS